MPKVVIDGREFDTETLSQEAKAQLEMLVTCESRLKTVTGRRPLRCP